MGRQCRKIARSVACCCYLSSLIVLFLCSEQSLATFNPAHHPQGHPAYHTASHQYYDNPTHQDSVDWNGGPPRGGSTLVASNQPPAAVEEPEPFEPPKVRIRHMSMALRLTSEWNRRLLEGVNRFKNLMGKRGSQNAQKQTTPQPLGYGSQPVNVHPSRAWHPPIQDRPALPDYELTLFHAKAPRESSKTKQRRGVARWGPELEPFLEHVVEMLEISDGVEIPLAMIYMDRACSVETPRSNGVPPCPFCMPRTVHRLSLVALLLAKQAVDGSDDIEQYYEKIQSLGIPLIQLQQMVEWMKGALGDQGMYVTLQEMKNWGHTWDATFFPKQHQQRLQQQQEPQHHHHHYHAPHQLESF